MSRSTTTTHATSTPPLPEPDRRLRRALILATEYRQLSAAGRLPEAAQVARIIDLLIGPDWPILVHWTAGSPGTEVDR